MQVEDGGGASAAAAAEAARRAAEEAQRAAEEARRLEEARRAAEAARRAEEARRLAQADGTLNEPVRGPFGAPPSPAAAEPPGPVMSPVEAAQLAAATPSVPTAPPSQAPDGLGDPLTQAAAQERAALEAQLADAYRTGDMESARALRALLSDPEKSAAYVDERARIGLAFDATFPDGGGLDRHAFVNAAQAERDRLANELQEARAAGDIESLRALNALVGDPAQASDYVLQRTVLSLSYDTARQDPAGAAVLGNLSREEYTTIVQRAQGDLATEQRQLEAQLATATSPEARAELEAQLADLARDADGVVTLRLATAAETERLDRALATGQLDVQTTAEYEALLADPARLEERVVIGQMFDAELARVHALGAEAEQALLAQAGDREAFLKATLDYRAAYAAEYALQEQAAGTTDAGLLDARTQLSLLYKDAQAGTGDPELVRAVQAGEVSQDDFLAAGVLSFTVKREREQANVDMALALQQSNPALTPEQAEADARAFHSVFFEIHDSEQAFLQKIEAFNELPAFYRGASRLHLGGPDVYNQQEEIGRRYDEITGKFGTYRELVLAGQGSSPEAVTLEAEMRTLLAEADTLAQRSIDESLGRATTVGPVIDVATDLIVGGASTFIPGGWAIAGGFSAMKGGMRGDVTDVGSGLLAFAQGAAFTKLGALGNAGVFTRAGSAVVKLLPAAAQGLRWLPAVAGVVLESGAQGVTQAGFTAAQLAHSGELDAGTVARAGLEGFAFGLAGTVIQRGATHIGRGVVAPRLGGVLPPTATSTAIDLAAGGISNAAADVLTQWSQDGTIDPTRVFLSGLSGVVTTGALGHASALEAGRRVPVAVQDFDGFVNGLRDPEGRIVDSRHGRGPLEPGSAEEAAYLAHLRENFNPAEWGARMEDARSIPPWGAGITPDMQGAIQAGLAAYAKASGVQVTGIGARKSEPDGSFWHGVDAQAGGPAYISKPGSTISIPYSAGTLVQPEMGQPGWGVTHSPQAHVTNPEAAQQIAALEAQAGGDPVRLQALLDQANQSAAQGGTSVRYVVHGGEVIQIQKVVSDLDLAYAVDASGRPLSDAQVLELGRHINAAYRDQGYVIDLVNHGAHFNGMLMDDYNANFRLTWKYQDQPVYNFTPTRYEGATRLLDTFRWLYDRPAWPVVETPGLAGTAGQYSPHLPQGPEAPAPATASPETVTAAPDSPYRQLEMDLD